MSEENERPQVSFIAFVFSLASNAAVHFGDLPDPLTNETRPPDLEAAAQLIDLLAMLEEKTRGNLSAEERQLLDQAIFELRMRYVEAKKAQSPIIQPGILRLRPGQAIRRRSLAPRVSRFSGRVRRTASR